MDASLQARPLAAHRVPAFGAGGMVASGHPLATLAGLDVLRRGGHAVDAAVATSAVLAVVQPGMSGLGGDAIFLIRDVKSGSVRFLNGTGRAPAAATVDAVRRHGDDRVPLRGPLALTVPGMVKAWEDALVVYGRCSLASLLEPAVHYAQRGFHVTPNVAQWLTEALDEFGGLSGCGWIEPWFAVYARERRSLTVGELLVQEDLAQTLRRIQQGGPSALYDSDIASQIATFVRRHGGFLSQDDLRSHTSAWGEPLRMERREDVIYQTPLNTQGVITLLMLAVHDRIAAMEPPHGPSELVRTLLEAKGCAFEVKYALGGEVGPQGATERQILSDAAITALVEGWLQRSRPTVTPSEANLSGDTTAFSVADGDGNVVVVVQSIFHNYGSGVLVPGTGIVLQNRGSAFTLRDGHANRLAPRKRPLHTLNACIVARGDGTVLGLGTEGGDGQPQYHVQVLKRVLDDRAGLQRALDAPRWVHGRTSNEPDNDTVFLETTLPQEMRQYLEERGYSVRWMDPLAGWTGQMHAVVADAANGILHGASDPRSDGVALGF